MSEPLVSVTVPADRYIGVARLVTAGVGARLNLPFDTLDDLQLAVELVVGVAFAQDLPATVSFASDGTAVTISISPLDPALLETTRTGFDTASPVRLRELLERLVDSVGTDRVPRATVETDRETVPAIILRKALEASTP